MSGNPTDTAAETLEAIISRHFPMEALKQSYEKVRQAPFPEVLKTEQTTYSPTGVMAFGGTSPDAKELLLQFQTHGNEPAWTAFYDVLADLEKGGLLSPDFRTILTLGNAPAADLFWQHWEKPETRPNVRERVDFRKVPGSPYQMNRVPYDKALSEFLDGPSPELDRAARLEKDVYRRPQIAAVFDGHTISTPSAHAFAVILNTPSQQQWEMLAHSGVSRVISNIGKHLGGDGIADRIGVSEDAATRLIVELGQHEDPLTAARVAPIALQLLAHLGGLIPEAKTALEALIERQPERFGGLLKNRVMEEYKMREGEGATFRLPDKNGYYILVPAHSNAEELAATLPARQPGENDASFAQRIAAFIEANPEFDSPLLNMQYLQKGDAIAFDLEKRSIVPSTEEGYITMAPRNHLLHHFDEVVLFYMDGPFARKLGQAPGSLEPPEQPDTSLMDMALLGGAWMMMEDASHHQDVVESSLMEHLDQTPDLAIDA